jgi:signal transduction histidine kinase/uncharacterized protein YoaH (UPF0181 family)
MSRPAQFAEPREQDRIEPERLADEQAALRRVATLVAQAASSTEVFSAVAQEVAEVLHLSNTAVCRYDDQDTVMTVLAVWGDHPDVFSAGSRWPLDGPSMSAEVLRTGRPVRIEDYADLPGGLAAAAHEHGFSRVAGAPIIVDGRVWGVISTSSPDAPLPANLEDRLGEFTELVATAIANSQAHDELTRLVEEQAALRRVATLAAQGAPPAKVFEAVSAEVAQLVQAEDAGVTRYEADGTFTALGGWTTSRAHTVTGRRFPLEGSLSGLIFETRGASRIDDFEDRPGPVAAAVRELGWRSAVGAPIFVEGRLWGALLVYSRSKQPLPPDTESRLVEFTEIVATAIASAENRQGLADLLEEQAALRRVATLVAAGAPAAELFEAVSAEVAALVGADGSALTRYEADGTVTAVGGWTEGGYKYVGTRYPVEGTVSGVIFETHRPGRVDNYTDAPGEAPEAAREMGWHASVGAPITVEGRLWGALAVVSKGDRRLPLDTERRLVEFTDLVASAIANSQAREEVGRLAEEQAALRRVATLVADGAEPAKVFEAVCAEVGRVIPADAAALSRREADGKLTALGTWTRSGGYTGIHLGEPFPLERGGTAHQVFATRHPARVESYAGVPGRGGAAARLAGWRSAVGSPIVVEGDLWGVITVASTSDRPLPADTEERLPEFTDLLATAIANADSRAELDASRARIVATADATRRRIERDLHDGAQQQLVSLALELRAMQAAAPIELQEHRAELSHVVEGLTSVLDGLREIALGIHPAILAEGGLGPSLKTLARRSPVPVELDLQVEGRLPEPVEVAAYYVVSEALTNAAKHAQASSVWVHVVVEDDVLRVAVRDDGLGGADARRGSGLIGLKDRAEAIGGSICVESIRGTGTSLTAELPLDEPTR